ncbi:UNVERIFIED_ORG: hypothetical protein ABIB52_003835 [Arthrobacter sp. UYCu721]
MAAFLRSRRAVLIVVIVAGLELSLTLWAGKAFKISHLDYHRAVPIAVPIQFLLVAILLYSVSSAFAPMERLASRPMRRHQALMWLCQSALVFGSLALACLIIGDTGNVGTYAPIKALAGLWGIGLLASTLLDRRVAGVLPVGAVILPFVLDPGRVPGVEVWGFTTEPTDDPLAWITALGFLCAGAAAHIRFSEGARR